MRCMKVAHIEIDASCYLGTHPSQVSRDFSPTYPAETLLIGAPYLDGTPMRIGYIISETQPTPGGEGIAGNTPTGRTIVARVGQYIGDGSINRAEYLALIHSLRHALRLGYGGAEVKTDSQLVARQVGGQYRVKDRYIKKLYNEVKELARVFPLGVSVTWIKRDTNLEADALTRITEYAVTPTGRTESDDQLLARWYAYRDDLNDSVVGRIFGVEGCFIRLKRRAMA